MFGHCLVPLRDTGLHAPLTQPGGLLGVGRSEIADTAGKDGVGTGKKSSLPGPLEWIFPSSILNLFISL